MYRPQQAASQSMTQSMTQSMANDGIPVQLGYPMGMPLGLPLGMPDPQLLSNLQLQQLQQMQQFQMTGPSSQVSTDSTSSGLQHLSLPVSFQGNISGGFPGQNPNFPQVTDLSVMISPLRQTQGTAQGQAQDMAYPPPVVNPMGACFAQSGSYPTYSSSYGAFSGSFSSYSGSVGVGNPNIMLPGSMGGNMNGQSPFLTNQHLQIPTVLHQNYSQTPIQPQTQLHPHTPGGAFLKSTRVGTQGQGQAPSQGPNHTRSYSSSHASKFFPNTSLDVGFDPGNGSFGPQSCQLPGNSPQQSPLSSPLQSPTHSQVSGQHPLTQTSTSALHPLTTSGQKPNRQIQRSLKNNPQYHQSLNQGQSGPHRTSGPNAQD